MNVALKLPFEFRGLARAFVQRLELSTAEAIKAQDAAFRYVAALMKRRPGKWHRPEHIDRIVALWTSQPTAGSLMEPDVTHGPHSLVLRSLRMLPATSVRAEWGDTKELAVMIAQHGLDIDRRGAKTDSGPLASISHHALGRRLQRGFGPGDDEAVTGDIRRLVAHFARAGITEDNADQPFVVPCPTGDWLGHVRRVTTSGRPFVVLSVRTFT